MGEKKNGYYGISLDAIENRNYALGLVDKLAHEADVVKNMGKDMFRIDFKGGYAITTDPSRYKSIGVEIYKITKL